jgi:hypothetical protein
MNPPGEPDLTRTYIMVLVVEALAIAGLYFLGKYFG